MNAKNFWGKVDNLISNNKINISEFCNEIGYSRTTIYSQRNRNQLPKLDQIEKMEKFFGVKLLECTEDSPFLCFIPYLEKATAEELRIIRNILRMPDPEKMWQL